MFSYSLNRYKEHMPASNQDLDSAREKMFDARRHSDSVARTIPQHTFAYAQRAVNPYELVQHLDNGENMWPRSFYTILELAALFPALRSAATAKTLHLCEAPGFFCDAVLRLSDGQADWHACSLSNRGMLFQKHLLLAKKSNGHSRVVFGERGTGDLQEKDTAMCIVYECGGNVSLVTADGADDEVQDQWSLTNVKLLAAQMFTALNALERGGCFVLRFDHMFQPGHQQYVWACFKAFTNVTIVKPKTTPIHMSTVYAVCTGYKKNAATAKLIKHLDSVAYQDATLDVGPLTEEEQLALNGALCQILSIQTKGLQDSAALAKYLYSTGVQTQADVRAHFTEHLSRNQQKITLADSLLKTMRQTNLCSARMKI